MAATHAACTGRARLKAWGHRARAERTPNMVCMVVTLDVSKLSGWLNADAYCRESKGGNAMWEKVYGPGGVRALGGGDGSGMNGKGPTQGWGEGTRGGRTRNIQRMSVTFDVSKLSGWLNAFATCRVERRACGAGRGIAREA